MDDVEMTMDEPSDGRVEDAKDLRNDLIVASTESEFDQRSFLPACSLGRVITRTSIAICLPIASTEIIDFAFEEA
jgi:hypothetical protein